MSIKNNRVNLRAVTLLLILGVGGIMLPLISVDALPTAEAQALVQKTSEHVRRALRGQQRELEKHPERIYPLVKDIVLPHFDFQRMAQLALGKYWRQAGPEQRQRFVAEFQTLLVRTYSMALIKHVDEKIHYLPVRGPRQASDIVVRMEVLQRKGGGAVPMHLHLYERKGAWKVFDVKVDGVSLVTNYRTSFANEVRRGGMDKLIESLKRKNNNLASKR